MKRWWTSTREEIYVYRTDRPYGWGRHFAYVGRTNNPARRHREHMIGGGRFDAKPKPWADLNPKRYVFFKLKKRTRLFTHFLEWFTIRLLWPVYNIDMNYWNPRRIKPWVQDEQRRRRDMYGARTVVKVATILRVAVLACGLFFGSALLISHGNIL